MAILRELGNLRTGYQIRGAVEPIPEGPHRIVLLGDIQDDAIDWQRIARTHLRTRAEDFLTHNDIIIRSRGAHYGVALASHPPDGTVVAAPLFLLSIRGEATMPEYVAWYLNRPSTRSILENMARGTSLPTISIRELGELDIPVPSIEMQREIADIVHWLRQEREISKRLVERRAQLADAVLGGLVQGRMPKKLPPKYRPKRLIQFDDEDKGSASPPTVISTATRKFSFDNEDFENEE